RQALGRAEAEQRGRAEAQEQMARQILDMYTEVVEKLPAHHPHLQEVQVAFLLKAARYYERLAQEAGTDPALRHKAGNALRRVGEFQGRLGQLAPAKETFDKAVALQAELVAQFPAVPEYRQGLAAGLESLSLLLKGLRRPAEAEQAHRRALPLRGQPGAPFPPAPPPPGGPARGQGKLAGPPEGRGPPGGAGAALRPPPPPPP